MKEDKQKQFEDHKALPFPSMEGLELSAEFAMLDGDIAGEVQGIISGSKSEFDHLESYKKTLSEIKADAEQKQLEDVVRYLDSLGKLLE